MKSQTSIINRLSGSWAKTCSAALMLLCAIAGAPATQASTLLLADTTMVTGNESASFSFNAPASGTVSVELTNLDWPQALSSLSFVASTPTQVLSSWSDPSSQPNQSPELLTFQVNSPGTYFADIMATAGGPMDLGVYSFVLDFTPAGATVPLPGAGWLLLAGVLGLIGLRRFMQRQPEPSVT
jgi:hypothetical protein